MNKKTLIHLKNAVFRQANAFELRVEEWILNAGERWVVYGPNGSGKSLLAEQLVLGRRPEKGNLAYLFLDDPLDEPGLHDVIHVALEQQRDEALSRGGFYQARWNSVTEDEETVADFLSAETVYGVSPFQVLDDGDVPADYGKRLKMAVREMRIGNLLHSRIVELSNGEIRKVLLARALAQHPKVLFLDEPFGGLDVSSRAHLNDVISSYCRRGMCVVVLVSRMMDVARVDTCCAYMENGCLLLGMKPERANNTAAKKNAGKTKSQRMTLLMQAFPAFQQKKRLQDKKPLIDLRNGTVKYGRKTILRNIHWTVQRGENWALLGPNGAGKSTLISLITGDNPQAYRNELYLFGRRRGSGESIWEIKRRIGLLSPEIQMNFPGDVNGLDVVLSGLEDTQGLFKRPGPAARKKAMTLFEQLDQVALCEQSFGTMSTGEQRMVLLLRALIKAPELLILDEPCQGIDAAHSKVIRQWIQALGTQTGIQLIYVTHHAEELPVCVTHILTLGL